MTGDTISRRGLIFGAAAAALIAACGDGGDSPQAAGGSSAPAGGGTFPATVTHQFGTTTVEAAPEAVVSLGWADADVLLALGVVPVGILDWFQAWPQGRRPVGAGEAERRQAATELKQDAVLNSGSTYAPSGSPRRCWPRSR